MCASGSPSRRAERREETTSGRLDAAAEPGSCAETNGGELHAAIDAKWSLFDSVQHFAVQRPGFVWDARVRMAPLGTKRVRDSYIGGHARMLAKPAGLVAATVA